MKIHQYAKGIAIASLSFAGIACATMRSTLYSPDAADSCEPVRKHLKGVPTTLEVPSHVQITVKRTRLGKANEKGFVTFIPELETRAVDVEIKKQKEIFGVDFTRPGAGSLKYKLDFTGEYITGVDNASDDQTIAKVTALVTTILNQIPVPGLPKARALAQGTSQLMQFEDVIASEIFPINEPGVDDQIQSFLNTYVNNCHDCVQDRSPAPIQVPVSESSGTGEKRKGPTSSLIPANPNSGATPTRLPAPTSANSIYR